MNRLLLILLILLLAHASLQGSAESQASANYKDSLRIEVAGQIKTALDLLDISSADVIDSAQAILDSVLNAVLDNFDYYDTLLVKTYITLSRCLHAKYDYDSATQLALKALEISEKIPGINKLLPSYAYEILVECCLQTHDLVMCEQYCEQRFKILDNLSRPLNALEAEEMIDALNDRARLLALQNKPEAAIDDLEYGLTFITDEMEKGPRLRADLNGNIAWVLARQGKLAESEARLLKVLEMQRQAYHPKHPMVLMTIHMLGSFALAQGNYNRADSLMDIELALSDEIQSKTHPMRSSIFQQKSNILLAQGRPGEALDFAMQAVAINKEVTGDYPSDRLMGSLQNAGTLAMAAGDWELAENMFSELLAHRYSFLNTVFGYASENEKLNYLGIYPSIINSILSGSINPSGKRLEETAFNMILRGKGMAIDAIAAEQAAAICSSDPLLDSLIMERRDICSDISGLFLSSREYEEDITRKLQELYERKDAIEKELSQNCSGMHLESNDAISVDELTSKISDRSVLCEFIRFTNRDITKPYNSRRRSEQIYMAMILTPDTNITAINLGNAGVLDSLIGKYHDVMSEALQTHLMGEDNQFYQQYIKVSNQLYHRLISPLTASLADIDKVYIAPDGMLNLLPFETLTQDGKRFLIDDYQFVYLTSGRDLLRDRPDLSGRDAFVIADPDFMTDPSGPPVPAEAGSSSMFASRGNAATPECLASMFSPLPMTRKEGIWVAELLNQTGRYDVTYLELGQAREGALKRISNPPDILHIATHGYFCERAQNAHLSNPLLRSGLILAGANRTIGEMDKDTNGSEDGILTAMEVSGLDLVGTDLVVLSACQTGIGDVRSGEGVFGLRRAFQHAGAKSVVMSMFEIPDESASELMERFYENWLSGQSKASALHNASLEILNDRRQNGQSINPLFWGGFILVADPE